VAASIFLKAVGLTQHQYQLIVVLYADTGGGNCVSKIMHYYWPTVLEKWRFFHMQRQNHLKFLHFLGQKLKMFPFTSSSENNKKKQH